MPDVLVGLTLTPKTPDSPDSPDVPGITLDQLISAPIEVLPPDEALTREVTIVARRLAGMGYGVVDERSTDRATGRVHNPRPAGPTELEKRKSYGLSKALDGEEYVHIPSTVPENMTTKILAGMRERYGAEVVTAALIKEANKYGMTYGEFREDLKARRDLQRLLDTHEAAGTPAAEVNSLPAITRLRKQIDDNAVRIAESADPSIAPRTMMRLRAARKRFAAAEAEHKADPDSYSLESTFMSEGRIVDEYTKEVAHKSRTELNSFYHAIEFMSTNETNDYLERRQAVLDEAKKGLETLTSNLSDWRVGDQNLTTEQAAGERLSTIGTELAAYSYHDPEIGRLESDRLHQLHRYYTRVALAPSADIDRPELEFGIDGGIVDPDDPERILYRGGLVGRAETVEHTSLSPTGEFETIRSTELVLRDVAGRKAPHPEGETLVMPEPLPLEQRYSIHRLQERYTEAYRRWDETGEGHREAWTAAIHLQERLLNGAAGAEEERLAMLPRLNSLRDARATMVQTVDRSFAIQALLAPDSPDDVDWPKIDRIAAAKAPWLAPYAAADRILDDVDGYLLDIQTALANDDSDMLRINLEALRHTTRGDSILAQVMQMESEELEALRAAAPWMAGVIHARESIQTVLSASAGAQNELTPALTAAISRVGESNELHLTVTRGQARRASAQAMQILNDLDRQLAALDARHDRLRLAVRDLTIEGNRMNYPMAAIELGNGVTIRHAGREARPYVRIGRVGRLIVPRSTANNYLPKDRWVLPDNTVSTVRTTTIGPDGQPRVRGAIINGVPGDFTVFPDGSAERVVTQSPRRDPVTGNLRPGLLITESYDPAGRLTDVDYTDTSPEPDINGPNAQPDALPTAQQFDNDGTLLLRGGGGRRRR